MSKDVAVVFPGQGSQSSNMLADFYKNFASFSNVVAEASDKLNYNIWQVICDDDASKLNQTEFTQPAIVTVSFALWQIYKEEYGIIPKYLAGHSVGEYSALVAASVLSLSDAVAIVAMRGKLMQEAVPVGVGAMAAIIGLTDAEVVAVCNEASSDNLLVTPANFNSPGQIVIAGNKLAVEKTETIAKSKGAKKFIILDVSVPSHCGLMISAAEKLKTLLGTVTFNVPEIPVIHNFDVKHHTDKTSIVDVLVKQLYSPVQWTQTIEFFANNNISKVIECGPGKVLTGLNKRISKEIESTAIGDIDNFKAVL